MCVAPSADPSDVSRLFGFFSGFFSGFFPSSFKILLKIWFPVSSRFLEMLRDSWRFFGIFFFWDSFQFLRDSSRLNEKI